MGWISSFIIYQIDCSKQSKCSGLLMFPRPPMKCEVSCKEICMSPRVTLHEQAKSLIHGVSCGTQLGHVTQRAQ
ncbi:hypothetical protein INR49_021142, partial [Caranx melampygus]